MKKVITDYIVITLGLILISISIHFFLVPDNLAAGGLSGLAMVLNYYFSKLGIGIIMFVGNIIFFIIGFMFIGKDFGVRTIYASLMLSVIIGAMEFVIPMKAPLTGDIFINLIFGIIIGSIGMAIVLNRNASTGGTDIPAKILNKYFYIEIGKSLLIIDCIVTLIAIIAFGTETGMYSILGVIINGFAIDYVIEGLNIIKKVEIISSKGEVIKKFIIEELNRSATIYEGKGAYNMKEKEIIVTVLNKKEFLKLKTHIKEVDSEAFVIIYTVHEVLGDGFGNIL